jgi:ABC-2 type transport system permease protein
VGVGPARVDLQRAEDLDPSGILLPMTLAPRWLCGLSELNPFRHIVDAARAAFRNDLGDSALVIGLICAAALAVVGLAIATHTFRRESA